MSAAATRSEWTRHAVVVGAFFVAIVLAACGGGGDASPAASTDCAACHMSDFRSATHPMHAGQKPTKCAVCHTNYDWHPSRVDHPFFSLGGAHAKASCFDCHTGNPARFGGTPKECVGCHRADYDESRFPGHSSFPLTCQQCHSVSAWKPTLSSFVPHQTEPASAATATQPRKSGVPSPPEPRRRGTAASAHPAPSPSPAPEPGPAPHAAPSPETPQPTAAPYTPQPSPRPRPDSVSGASKHR